jgi:hypothetical protein
MSLLNQTFNISAPTSEPPSEVTKQSTNQEIENGAREQLVRKYQYDFTLSPMQNAYLEINARNMARFYKREIYFSGNLDGTEFQMFKYMNCVRNIENSKKWKNGIHDPSICDIYFPEIKEPKLLLSSSYSVNYSPLYDNNNKFKHPDQKDDDKHMDAINELNNACPNYNKVLTDPSIVEHCYGSALKYWQTVVSIHMGTNRDLLRTDDSNLLRKYYFNSGGFGYPKYPDIE